MFYNHTFIGSCGSVLVLMKVIRFFLLILIDFGNNHERVSKTDIANNLKDINCNNLKATDLI